MFSKIEGIKDEWERTTKEKRVQLQEYILRTTKLHLASLQKHTTANRRENRPILKPLLHRGLAFSLRDFEKVALSLTFIF